VKYSDQIICVSDHITSQFNRSNKIITIYGGFDNTKIDQHQKYAIRDDLKINKDSIIIANIGQLTKWKNQEDFIQLAKIIIRKIENVYFILVGDDLSGYETRYKKSLIQLITIQEDQSKIIYLGWRDNINEILENVDILVHTAKDEPFGRVIVEAMTMQTPVVAYNCGGPKEIIVNKQTGYLIEPFNFEELVDKVQKLIENADLRSKFGEAGRQRAIEKFNIERYTKEMKEVFDHI
jgi:glycosyltransferase involved in cell wall biosynthesis